MALTFSHIHHAYNGIEALRDVSLRAEAGQITCLLGPSGCGKTTLLNLAAGILPVQHGEIFLENELLAGSNTNPPPEKRPVGLVFQDGALFPHMSVQENVGFGISGTSGQGGTVSALLDQVGLAGMEKRYPHTLSGGQKQRVALARALAPEPRVVLLDEPFANIDIMLRRSLREETRRLLKTTDTITILVTHDPEEAVLMSDSIAIMSGGKIIQQDTAEAIYNKPVSLEAALLTGQGQVLSAMMTDNGVESIFGVWQHDAVSVGAHLRGAVSLLLRPDVLVPEISTDGLLVSDIRRLGNKSLLTVRAPDGETLIVEAAPVTDFAIGCSVNLIPKNQQILAFSA